MSKRRAVVELVPGRIDVVAYERGRQVDARRLDLEQPGDVLAWTKRLRRTGASLRPIVESMDLVGAPATVLYRSPTQAVDLAGFAVRAAGQAVEAGRLAATDALPYSALAAVSEGVAVGRDRGGETPQTHVVVAAEREDVAEAIASMIDAAGMTLASATPIDAAIMARLVGLALNDRKPQRGWLYVGEFSSFFIVAGSRSLTFSRRIDLGVDALATSLTRPIYVGGGSEPIELDFETARTLLHEHGVPDRDRIVHEPLGLTGGQVIPLLQPVLQRFMVELRQSLRFGVSEEGRQVLSIHLTGPGAVIPGLAGLIAEELGVETTVDDAYRDHDWSTPASKIGERRDALRDRILLRRLNLLPRPLARHRRIARLRRWMWTGAVGAVAIIGVDWFRYQARLGDARREADVYAAQLTELESLQTTSDRLRSTIDAVNELQASIETEVGFRIDHRAGLHEISRITPSSIRLTAIRFDRLPEGNVGMVSGYAIDEEDDSGGTSLEGFLARLEASPLFGDAVLGNVRRARLGERESQRFEATFEAIAVPRVAAERVAGAGGGSP